VNADGSAVRTTADPWEIGGYLNYGRNQLVTVSSAGDVRQKVLSGRLGGDFFASVTIARPFAIGLDIPFFVVQTGDAKPSFAGLDDIRLVSKLRILDDVSDGIGLAIAAEVRAPTHAGDFSGGTRFPVLAPRLIVDHRFGALRLGANAGATIREKTTYFNIVAASEIAYAAALEYRFGGIDGKVALGAELLGGVGLVKSSKEELPHELFPFLKYDPTTEVELLGGAGVGLVAGYGVPVVRAFFGIVYRPTSHDAEHDGIPDKEDRCPNEAEAHDRDRRDRVTRAQHGAQSAARRERPQLSRRSARESAALQREGVWPRSTAREGKRRRSARQELARRVHRRAVIDGAEERRTSAFRSCLRPERSSRATPGCVAKRGWSVSTTTARTQLFR
jgi:OOP family OmpA-OmpF porin